MSTAVGVEFLDPRADPATPVTPYSLSTDFSKSPVTIGLLANGFPDSVAFLDRLGLALTQELSEIRLRVYDKGDPTASAPNELLESIAAECQAVVGAYGH